MTAPKMVPLPELVFDFTLYPRSKVDSGHVTALAAALVAGAELPPIVADRKSKRVVDGFHRSKAYSRLLGPDVEVPVVFRTFKSEADLVRAALSLNASHGRPLTPHDRARGLALAELHNIELEDVASDLSMSVEAVTALRDARRAYGAGGRPIVLKATLAHLRGEQLTPEQEQANDTASGMRPLFHMNQLISLLEADAIEWSESFAQAATRLAELLEEHTRTGAPA